MKILFKEISVYKWKVPVVAIVWFALALAAAIAEVAKGSINNYIIFKYVFWHVLDEQHLYVPYAEYADVNHYGPLFSIVIAPFAVLPDWVGCILWCLANAAVLYYAIRRINIPPKHQLIIVGITAIEMMTAIHNVQFNPMVAAWIILAYVLIEEENEFWATLFIAAGFLVKIYGIAALLFFVFSRHKIRFVLSFAFWMVALFCLPMLISSPSYIINSYKEWFERLVEKDKLNAAGYAYGGHQDISVMGMIRRMSRNGDFSNLFVMVPAAVLILAPLLRFKKYAIENFRLSYLGIVLLSVVIFSSSAESTTYVIAVSGAALWYVLHYKEYPKWANGLLIFLFLFTILSPTDLVPRFIRDNIIRAYALKALPCLVIWLWLIADVSFKNFLSPNPKAEP
ncbi:glycosyltransferase family 87 protein [Aridibaculum aurantiacum]|uniref:glycosyltransferase family 87 protein n=1 Tax=Aridibaculum aurantiacum TaxID=2810307 RepID=UPI001A957C9E|nr:glycosyltransferase family 87 protein [Aridibaculum aurantiacum]